LILILPRLPLHCTSTTATGKVTSTLLSISTASPVPTPSDNGACDRLTAQCKIDALESPFGAYYTAFKKLSCVLAFACRAGGAGAAGGVPRNVDDVIYLEFWHSMAPPPKATELQRLSENVSSGLFRVRD
jgi:hypothetical protein